MNGTPGIPGNVLGACGTCHNVTTAGPKFGVPSCMSGASSVPGLTPAIICHFTSPVTGTNATAGCNSCHGGLPAGPDGASTPNTANAHPKHTALSNVTCNTCHDGLGSGTQKHADGAVDVAFSTQAGATAAYTAATKTCANISCHSGYTPPAWTDKSCTACHGTPPNGTIYPNTANAHAKHNFACDTCHFGLGSGKPLHANGTPDVAFSTLAGTNPAYTAATKTCANIICHGGNTTPAWTATNVAGCTLCHSTAPTTVPHTAHSNVIQIITCEACHTGDGPGVTAVHPDAFVVKGFPDKYNDGGAGYASGVCSNISCHGGHPTNYVDPTGVACLNCHTVRNNGLLPPVQYIDVYNGTDPGSDLHMLHKTYLGAVCTDCHNLVWLRAEHFKLLGSGKNKTLVPGFAKFTLHSTAALEWYNYDISSPTGEKGACAALCHSGGTTDIRYWFK